VIRSVLPVVAVAIALCGCASTAVCRSGEQASVHDTLYFGTGRPDGGVVSVEEWTRFLESIVTPRFPQGLTVSDVSGQWRGNDGSIVREATHVLQLVHPGDTDSNGRVDEIAQAYKTQFEQEAVLRVSSRVCTSFSP
jgi:hypothetical protein